MMSKHTKPLRPMLLAAIVSVVVSGAISAASLGYLVAQDAGGPFVGGGAGGLSDSHGLYGPWNIPGTPPPEGDIVSAQRGIHMAAPMTGPVQNIMQQLQESTVENDQCSMLDELISGMYEQIDQESTKRLSQFQANRENARTPGARKIWQKRVDNEPKRVAALQAKLEKKQMELSTQYHCDDGG